MKEPSRVYGQWQRIKAQYDDVLILFRLGDFYEAFEADAYLVRDACGVTMTTRQVGPGWSVPMVGFPYHASEGYIKRLVAAGLKVGVVEQRGPMVDGLVQREVTKVLAKEQNG